MKTIQRRKFIQSATALLALPMFQASPAFAQAAKMAMGAGLAQEPGALVLRIQQERLLDQAARDLGLAGIDAEFLSFPVLLRMLQGRTPHGSVRGPQLGRRRREQAEATGEAPCAEHGR